MKPKCVNNDVVKGTATGDDKYVIMFAPVSYVRVSGDKNLTSATFKEIRQTQPRTALPSRRDSQVLPALLYFRL